MTSEPPVPPSAGRSLLLYAAGWVLAGAIVALALVALLHGFRGGGELPPLRQVEFAEAARKGRCELRQVDDFLPGNPPAAGRTISRPTAPRVYEKAPTLDGLISALREGVVVIHYRASVGEEVLEQLRLVHEAAPKSTIVTPNTTRMPYLVAAAGWRRLLGCRAFTSATLDALRLFRARNLGRGPDSD